MPNFQSAQIARAAKGRWHSGEPERIGGFCFDTRRIESGDCFVALRSETRDGHDFIEEAARKGASCALAERPMKTGIPQLVVDDTLSALGAIAANHRLSFNHPVVAITGSCGKTSTKEMLRLLLGADKTLATAGNWNNRIGVPMTLFGLDPNDQEFAVIEAGINQPGEMALLGEMIRADLTILTNIGPAHLERLGSLEGIAVEKSKLAEMAKGSAPLVLPAEALQYPAYAKMADRCIALHFDASERVPQVRRAVECRIESAPDGATHNIRLEGQNYRIATSSHGIAQNAGLALVAALELGLPAQVLAERIAAWVPEATRGRTVQMDDGFSYIDCYNANPASMRDALQAFQRISKPDLNRCYILGAMNELGKDERAMHLAIGKSLLLRQQDRALLIGPAHLTEAYLQGCLQAGAMAGQIECFETTEAARSSVAQFKGAFFLKGSRSYQLESLLSHR